MELRNLGRSGLRVSAIGLGCNNFGGRLDEGTSIGVIHAAIDAGINFLDTADIYGTRGASETIIGKALAGGRRDQVVIGTKFGAAFDGEPPGQGAGPAWIAAAVEGSLRRLQTDRIDLYQQHVFDPTVPIEETQGALAELVAAEPELGPEAARLLEPGVPVTRRTTPGGAGPAPVAVQLDRYRDRLAQERFWLTSLT